MTVVQPEPGSHYTAWSSVSTLIKKQLVTKSGTVPAKYMLTETGLELAQKLIRVKNSMNAYSSDHIECSPPTTTTVQKSREDFESIPSDVSVRQSKFVSQEVVEDLEERLPKPWLLCQEDGHLTSGSKNLSISSQEELVTNKEVIISDRQLSMNSRNTELSVSNSLLPGNPVIHSSVQSDELRYKHVECCGGLICLSRSSGNNPQFWYVDNEDCLVHEKNKAAILFNS